MTPDTDNWFPPEGRKGLYVPCTICALETILMNVT